MKEIVKLWVGIVLSQGPGANAAEDKVKGQGPLSTNSVQNTAGLRHPRVENQEDEEIVPLCYHFQDDVVRNGKSKVTSNYSKGRGLDKRGQSAQERKVCIGPIIGKHPLEIAGDTRVLAECWKS